MKMKNILFGLLFIIPTVSYGAVAGIQDRPVPVSRIADAAQKYPELYNSDFVFFLEHSVSDKNFTLGNVAQACLDYTAINKKITAEICTKFMNDIIGETHSTDETHLTDSTKTFPDSTKTFVATTTPDTTEFKFHIYAAGNYTVDCGDENPVQEIPITNAKTGQEIKCKYSEPGAYNIIIGGRATGYVAEPIIYNDSGWPSESYPAITFNDNKNLAGIDGSLGAIFPTLNNSQPIFYRTFSDCTNLKGSIPENLFSGIKGAPAKNMFDSTFFRCSGLKGTIPANLFSGIQRAPAEDMFAATFYGCSGLTGSIPENLFSGISGTPAKSMFNSTFTDCSGLKGTIPANLFSGIQGAPAKDMFYQTFTDCSGLTGSIPANLFSRIQGAPADNMFVTTFYGCSGLTGDVTEKFFGNITGGVTAYDVEDWDTFGGTQITFK